MTNGRMTLSPQGRRNGGFSLRKSLELQGVTTEDDMRKHLATVHSLLPRGVDVTQYRAERK